MDITTTTESAGICGQSADFADTLRTDPHQHLIVAWDAGKRIRLAPIEGDHPWRRKGEDPRPMVFEWSLAPSAYEIHPEDELTDGKPDQASMTPDAPTPIPEPTPDYGEPWQICNHIVHGSVADKHGQTLSSEKFKLRAITCVNACAGMSDPAAEIQAMRESKMGLCGLSTRETWSKIQEVDGLRRYIGELEELLSEDESILSGINRLKMENKAMRDERYKLCVAMRRRDKSLPTIAEEADRISKLHSENKAMRDALKEAQAAINELLKDYQCKSEVMPAYYQANAALAALKPFLP